METILKPHTWRLLGAGLATVESHSVDSQVGSSFTRLYLITEGNGTLTINDHLITLQEGYMYIVPAFCRFMLRYETAVTFYYLHVQPDIETGLLPLFDGWVLPDKIKVLPSESVIFPELLRLNPGGNPSDEYPRQPVKIITDALINVLMARWLMDSSPVINDPKPHGLAQLIDKLRLNPTVKMTTGEMAAETGMSPGHFSRVFKQATGMTPVEFVRHQLMMQAQIRLTTENTQIKTIAQDLGYDDYNYFTRVFTKDVGMTPTQFRRVSREGLLPG